MIPANTSTPKKTFNAFEQGLLRYLSEAQLKTIQSVKIGIGGAMMAKIILNLRLGIMKLA